MRDNTTFLSMFSPETSSPRGTRESEKARTPRPGSFKAEIDVYIEPPEVVVKKSQGRHRRSRSEPFIGLKLQGIGEQSKFGSGNYGTKVSPSPSSDLRQRKSFFQREKQSKKQEKLISLKEIEEVLPKPVPRSDFSPESIREASKSFTTTYVKSFSQASRMYRGTMDGNNVWIIKLKDAVLSDCASEIGRMKRVPHPNIQVITGACFEESCIVCELYPKGNLQELIEDSEGKKQATLSWDEKLRVAIELVSAVLYLQNAGLLYSIVKPSNVFFDEENSVKLNVWGGVLSHLCGKKSVKKDPISSLGYTILQMCSNEPSQTEIEERIKAYKCSSERERDLAAFLPQAEGNTFFQKREALLLIEVGLTCAMAIDETRKTLSLSSLLHKLSQIQQNPNAIQLFSPNPTPSPREAEFREISNNLGADELKDIICLCKVKTMVDKATQILVQKAAEGDAESQLVLAEAYHYGWSSLQVDHHLAYKWMTMSKLNGCKDAQNKLEDFFETLSDALKNPTLQEKAKAEAAEILRKASFDGFGFARYKLGECYERGFGVPVDYLTAMDCFLTAANDGISEAYNKFLVA